MTTIPNTSSASTAETSAAPKSSNAEQKAIEDMINTVAVNIMAPKIMKRAQQTMNEAINGDDDKEIII